jgi:REP element-mobilizing transposase RayT
MADDFGWLTFSARNDLVPFQMARRVRQTEMRFRTHGGRRKNAGRKPNGARAGVWHLARPELSRRCAVHVTVRMKAHVYNLRSRRCFRALAGAFSAGRDRFGFRLIHYSVQGNHIHFLVEAEDKRALSRGMQGLTIRMARALNRVMKRNGKVFADRYHARTLRTPTEVAHVRHYLLQNAARHYRRQLRYDEYASSKPVTTPRTWLVRRLL